MAIRYIDSHAHIMSEEFQEDFPEIIRRIEDTHIDRVMIICTQAEEARRAMEFAKTDPERYKVAYGIHPEDIRKVTPEMIEEFNRLIEEPGIAAVGEIGLDYHWEKEMAAEQKELFILQIEAAKRVGKPFLVHSRDAIQDTYDIMKEHRTKGLMHCFPGSLEMAKEFIKLGYYIALGGAVTFKNARHSKEVCAGIDPDYLLTETDCPYMTPVPFRGKRNEPSYIPYIVRVMAEVRGISEEEMAEIIFHNYERFLNE